MAWFWYWRLIMASDTGDKTEAPTPRRLSEAREKGQVAKSTDLTAAICLLVALIILNYYATGMTNSFLDMFTQAFAVHQMPTNAQDVLREGGTMAMNHLLTILGPLLLFLFLSAIICNVMQIGFILTGKPITPSLDKISPLSGFKRIFSARSAMKTALSLAKVTIVGLVAGQTINNQLNEIISLSGLSFLQIISAGGQMTFILGVRLCLILLILAIIDFSYQKYKHIQDLKMSKEEVKEEMKRMEGDPYMKQRRRSVARQLASQRMAQAVPKADVVVTNPTELALALKYDPDTMAAPKLVAKGAGYMAQRIRRIALESGVPIVERKPLARALFKSCEIGDSVPAELYKAVAEVLAYVFELNEKGFKKKTTVTKPNYATSSAGEDEYV